MRKLLLALTLTAATPMPAQATAGLFCSSGGPRPVEVSLTIGRVIGGPLVSATLVDSGTEVPAERAQWWLDDKELRLILIDPNAEREELVIKARRRGEVYVGTLVRRTRSRPVRCEESG